MIRFQYLCVKIREVSVKIIRHYYQTLLVEEFKINNEIFNALKSKILIYIYTGDLKKGILSNLRLLETGRLKDEALNGTLTHNKCHFCQIAR